MVKKKKAEIEIGDVFGKLGGIFDTVGKMLEKGIHKIKQEKEVEIKVKGGKAKKAIVGFSLKTRPSPMKGDLRLVIRSAKKKK